MITYKLYKVLCYLTAVLNILLVIQVVIHVVLPVPSRAIADILFPPCLGNLCLAVILIFGVAKRMPSFIRLFRIFMFAQMAFLLMIAVYFFRLVVHGREDMRVAINATLMLIALFGIEALIASGGLQAVLSEPPPFEEGAVIFQRLV
ncbi:uncharacterized protein LOC109420233 isoform X3 [Aedes albopictus]|uniref:Secreted protein n=1 Tax=Aedes albopictus TaxID=7160 RepID=A0ABM1ZWP2_AEDAL|nr:uncharacterized protein LOC109420233 isoform X3 [Aedes albopictus]